MMIISTHNGDLLLVVTKGYHVGTQRSTSTEASGVSENNKTKIILY